MSKIFFRNEILLHTCKNYVTFKSVTCSSVHMKLCDNCGMYFGKTGTGDLCRNLLVKCNVEHTVPSYY
jgi:hypothetical protein